MASPTRGLPRKHLLNQQAFATQQGRREVRPSKVAPQDQRYERSRQQLAYALMGFLPRWMW